MLFCFSESIRWSDPSTNCRRHVGSRQRSFCLPAFVLPYFSKSQPLHLGQRTLLPSPITAPCVVHNFPFSHRNHITPAPKFWGSASRNVPAPAEGPTMKGRP